MAQYGLNPDRRTVGHQAAIIREKERAVSAKPKHSLWPGGIRRRRISHDDRPDKRTGDVGRYQYMIVFCGGFSIRMCWVLPKVGPVLLYNRRPRRHSTISMPVKTRCLWYCNGCQLMVELDLINRNLRRRRTCCTMTLISLNRSS